jgi:serine/threonine protein kinase
VKLAWALINIMNVIHHCGILHNDLSKDNIMLHFSPDKLNVMYIGVCNWGEVGCLQEVMSSLYGFAKEQDATNSKKMHLVDCPIVVYNESGIANSLRRMVKQHATTLRFEAYLVGKLTNVIWGENWDAKYFVDNSTKMSFGKLILDMYDPNPKAQRTIQHVMRTLMGLPYNWTAPKACY